MQFSSNQNNFLLTIQILEILTDLSALEKLSKVQIEESFI